MPDLASKLRLLSFAVMALFAGGCTVDEVEVTRIEPREVTRVVVETVRGEDETIEVTRMATSEPDEAAIDEPPVSDVATEVTLDLTSTTDIPTLDPQLASDSISVANIENLFVQLTNVDHESGAVSPEAARAWQISDDGLTYTFYLRKDIPWVYHNPVSGETRPVTDENGEQRMVTSQDFADGIRRACDPDIGAYYGAVLARVIAGCQELLNSGPEDSVQALVDGLGVSTPNDETLVIRLKFPASYFPSMTSLWTLSAIPTWSVEEYGSEWIEAGNIVSNGRFVLHEWVHGVQRSLVRNPYLPQDMHGAGNVERVVTRVVPDTNTTYALWLQKEVDVTLLPDGEVQAHLAQYEVLTTKVSELTVIYIGFVNNKAPFDDPRVRRAFSAAIDRQTLVDEVRQGQGRPMIHLAPPGIVGAPPIDEVGVGFDAHYARQQLALAGYDNCEGFPPVTIISLPGQDVLNVLEYVQGQWAQHLGCPPGIIQIEQQPFAVLLTATAADVPLEETPHMYTLAWAADYPDENNWVGDLLWCGNEGNRTRRACGDVDELIVEAAEEPDIDRRDRLYRQIEEAFFGPQGEMPIAPLTMGVYYMAVQPWVEQTPAITTDRWYDWRIDRQSKLNARR